MIKSVIVWGILVMLLISLLKWLISNDSGSKSLSEWWEDEE